MGMTRVAIIGGGIGGLTAALALRRAGLEVSVHEAAPELKEIGAGIALHANAMRVLRAIGVEDAVRESAGRTEWVATRNGKSGRVITGGRQQAGGSGLRIVTVHRADLLDVLAAALPDDLVTKGRRCESARTEGVTAVARFTDGTEIEADVIVGADGIHSAVRKSLFGPDAPRFTGKICYRSVIPAAAAAGSEVGAGNGQWLGPHGTIVVYPVRGRELINVVCHYDDDSYQHESWVTECERAEVLARYAGWYPPLLRLFEAGDTWYKWALYDRDPIPAWTQGRVTLLGDAAHPMLPYLGQGACQAMEDGAVLATALTATTSAGGSAGPAGALAAYEAARRPRASRVVLAAREQGVRNHLASPWDVWRRDAAIAWRRRFPRRGQAGGGPGWLFGYDATSPDVLVPDISSIRPADPVPRTTGSDQRVKKI
jgi:salicylate hydroxylase